MKAGRVLGLAAALICAAPSRAQTVIAPTRGAGDAGTTIATVANVTTIANGTLVGANLFHSFDRFDLARGDIAQWVRSGPDAASVANVINRVTGGDPSDIDGTLRVSNMPNAAFWFLNPAGVLFGAGAAIDVPGAAYFSTAQALRFADGRSFTMTTPGGSTFSSAAPEAFGFLGGQGDIVAAGVGGGFASPRTALVLAAANVRLGGQPAVKSLGFTALGSDAAELRLADPLSSFTAGTALIGGNAAASDIAAASFRVAAGQVVVDNATVHGTATGVTPPDSAVAAGSLTLRRGYLSMESVGVAAAGGINLTVGSLSLTDSALFTSAYGGGAAGDIVVNADVVRLDNSDIDSSTFGRGNAGLVSVRARDVALGNSSFVVSLADVGSSGRAGDVRVQADTLILDASEVDSSTWGSGDAGSITVRAGNVRISDGGFYSRAERGAVGNAGAITVDADSLILDFADIDSSTTGPGNAGAVTVRAREVALGDAANIVSRAREGSTGNAGRVSVSADTVKVADAAISSSTFGSGNAGNVLITAGDAAISDTSFVSSNAGLGSTGNAGRVDIVAGRLLVDNAIVATSTFGSGAAGSVSLRADDIRLTNSGAVSSRSESTGNAGDVSVVTTSLRIDGAARLQSAATGPGRAGSVEVAATVINVADGGAISTNAAQSAAGTILLTFPRDGRLRLEGDTPGLITTTSGTNSGGRITITDPYLILSAGGKILALGEERGANVNISSDFFIRSADRLNRLSVAGSLVLDSQLGDLSTGTDAPDVTFLDASAVLRGQCAVARASGRVSRFTSRMTGPYAPVAQPHAVELRGLTALPPILVACR